MIKRLSKGLYSVNFPKHNQKLEIKLKPSNLAKRLILRAGFNQIQLVVPTKLKITNREAFKYLFDNSDWVINRVSEQKALYANNDELPIFSQPHSILYSKEVTQIKLENNTLYLPIVANQKLLIKNFLKELLYKELLPHIQEVVDKIKVRPTKINIKDTKTRWGSCSSKGHLSFSWRLVFAPISVIRYVAIHEAAHLSIMSHSQKFWQLIEMLDPYYMQSEKWLKLNGRKLHYYLLDS